MKLLALDPALCCGFAWSDGTRLEYGVWQLAGRGAEHHGNRLIRFREFLTTAIDKWGCDKIAFEEASFGSRHAHVQSQHNQLAGVILLVAAERSLPYVGFKPSTIKKFATGHGFAKKDQMIRALETHFGICTESSDVADAIFILELAKQEHKAQERRPKPVKPRRPKEPRLFK